MSNLGNAAKEYKGVNVFRITKDHDFSDPGVFAALKQEVKSRPECSLHGSLPCAVWSTWQNMAVARYGEKYKRKLEARRRESVKFALRSLVFAASSSALGGLRDLWDVVLDVAEVAPGAPELLLGGAISVAGEGLGY